MRKEQVIHKRGTFLYYGELLLFGSGGGSQWDGFYGGKKVGEQCHSFHNVQVSLKLIWKLISFCIYSFFVLREFVQLISLLPSSWYCFALMSLVQSSQWCWDGGAAGSCGYTYWNHLHWKKQDIFFETARILMWPLLWRTEKLGNWKWKVKSPTTNRFWTDTV